METFTNFPPKSIEQQKCLGNLTTKNEQIILLWIRKRCRYIFVPKIHIFFHPWLDAMLVCMFFFLLFFIYQFKFGIFWDFMCIFVFFLWKSHALCEIEWNCNENQNQVIFSKWIRKTSLLKDVWAWSRYGKHIANVWKRPLETVDIWIWLIVLAIYRRATLD